MNKRTLLACFSIVASTTAACDRSAPPAQDTQGPASSAAAATKTIRASGSSALAPLINAAKERFEAKDASKSVEVSTGGSKKGLSDVSSGAVEIGASDIEALANMSDLVDHKVAVVGFAAMANKGPWNEDVSAVTKEDLAKIFQGKITNWEEVGGKSQAIVVINRAPGSGTRAVFGDRVLGGDTFVESQTEDNSGALVAKLKQTKGAISYLAFSYRDPALLTLALKSDSGVVEATEANVTAGSYPIWSYEHLFTKGAPTGVTKEFVDYMLSPTFQDEVLSTVKGFIPVTKMKSSHVGG